MILEQVYWAKDIIILFTDHGIHGANAWMSSYNGQFRSKSHLNQPLITRAGSIQAAIVLDFKVIFNFDLVYTFL